MGVSRLSLCRTYDEWAGIVSCCYPVGIQPTILFSPQFSSWRREFGKWPATGFRALRDDTQNFSSSISSLCWVGVGSLGTVGHEEEKGFCWKSG